MTEEYIVRILENDDCITEGELIRCKDCKWYEADHRFCHKTKSVTLTSNWDIEIYHKTSPEGFCEKAERIQHD